MVVLLFFFFDELQKTVGVGVTLVCEFLKMSLCVTLLFGEQQLWHTCQLAVVVV